MYIGNYTPEIIPREVYNNTYLQVISAIVVAENDTVSEEVVDNIINAASELIGGVVTINENQSYVMTGLVIG